MAGADAPIGHGRGFSCNEWLCKGGSLRLSRYCEPKGSATANGSCELVLAVVGAGGRADGGELRAAAVVLAIGHTASRDAYLALAAKGVAMVPKPFALGFRMEHPQALILSCNWARIWRLARPCSGMLHVDRHAGTWLNVQHTSLPKVEATAVPGAYMPLLCANFQRKYSRQPRYLFTMKCALQGDLQHRMIEARSLGVQTCSAARGPCRFQTTG